MAKKSGWDVKQNVSKWWYLAGLLGTIGAIAAIIYVLVSDSRMKIFSLLFLISLIGPAIVYFLCKKDDWRLANLAQKLFIGQVIVSVLALIFGFSFLL
jgi:hypothetical protein